jgi:hypothetical protein
VVKVVPVTRSDIDHIYLNSTRLEFEKGAYRLFSGKQGQASCTLHDLYWVAVMVFGWMCGYRWTKI